MEDIQLMFETESAKIIMKSGLFNKMIESGESKEDVLKSMENQCKEMFGDDIFSLEIDPKVLKLYDFLTIPFEETQYKLWRVAWRDDFKEILDEIPFLRSTIFKYCGNLIFDFREYLSCAKFLLMFGKIKDLGLFTQNIGFHDIIFFNDQESTNFFWDLVFKHGIDCTIIVELKQKEAFNWYMRKLLKVYDKCPYPSSFFRRTILSMHDGSISMYEFIRDLERQS